DLREFAVNTNGIRQIASRQLAIELLVQIVERGGGQVFDPAVLVEESDGGEWCSAVKVGHADGAVGERLKDFAVEHDHLTIKTAECSDTEVTRGKYISERHPALVIAGCKGGKQRELHQCIVGRDLGRFGRSI